MCSCLPVERPYAALHNIGHGRYLGYMIRSSAFSRECFTILDGEHIRIQWSDLEAVFDLEGLSNNPPLALIRSVLVRCGSPAWVWDAEAKIDKAGVMFRRVWSRSAA